MQFSITVDIAASREQVWAVLVDVERWPEWTTSTTRVELLDAGALTTGSRARVKQPRLPALVWEVTELVPGHSFTWKTTNAGVTSVAHHQLMEGPRGHIAANVGIRQFGPLAWLVGLLTAGMTRRAVQMEAQGLKQRCETE